MGKRATEANADKTGSDLALPADSPPVAHIRILRDNLAYATLKPLTAVLTLLYGVLAPAHLLLLSSPTRELMATMALVSALVTGTLWVLHNRGDGIRPATAHRFLGGLALIIFVNSAAHLMLTADPIQVSNLVLLCIGAGFVLFDRRWFIAVCGLAVLAWVLAATVIAPHPLTGQWLHFGFALGIAVALAVVIHLARARNLNQIAWLRHRDQQQQRQLQTAVERAEAGEARFQLLANASMEGIALHRSGVIVDANPAMAALFGTTVDRMIGRHALDYTAPESRATLERMLRTASKEPFEAIGLREDGTTFAAQIHTDVITVNGRPLSIASIRDLSSRREVERNLNRSESTHAALLTALPDAVIRLDHDGTVLDYRFPPEMSHLQPAERLFGRTLHDLLPENVAQQWTFWIDEAHADSESQFEFRTHANDEVRYYEARFASGWEGEVLVLIRDITARKEQEQRERRRARAAIEQVETQLRAVITTAPVIFLACDRSGNLTLAEGKRLDLIAEYTTPDVGMHYEHALAGLDTCVEAFSKALNGEESVKTLSLDDAYLEVRTLCVYGDEGLAGVLCVGLDITERVRAETALRESEQKFRNLVQRSQDAIMTIDVAGNTTYCNTAVRTIFGYEPNQFIEDPTLLHRILHPDHRSQFEALLARLKDHGAVTSTPTEWSWIHHDGHVVHTEIAFATIHDTDGYIAGVQALCRDITRRKDAERALEENRRTMATLMGNLPGMAYRCLNDEHWSMLFASEGTQALTGYAPKRFTTPGGLTYEEVILPDDRSYVRDQVAAALAGGKPFQLKYRIRHRNGSVRWVWERGSRTSTASDGQAILEGFVTDITDQVRTEDALIEAKEEAERASKIKDAIVANMSHEIRTPMTAVLGFSELLQRKLEDPEHLRYIEMIHRSGKRLLDMLNNIIDLAKLEAGELQMQLQPVNVATCVDQVVEMLQVLARDKDLSLSAHVPHDLYAVGEEHRIVQILTNIVGNAIRFTEEGGVDIRARTPVSAPDTIQIEVRDTGIGIDEAFLPYVFEEFRQESEGVGRRHEGSGLGLAIARKLAERMHGSIAIESAKHEGTTVTVFLPAATEGHALPEPNEADAERHSPADLPASRILLIEDDLHCQDLVRSILEPKHDVLICPEATDALAAARERQPELIFLDIHLRDSQWDGYRVLRELRMSEETRSIPVVALTAHALRGDRERLIEAGFDDYLSKPFTQAALYRMLSKYLLTNT